MTDGLPFLLHARPQGAEPTPRARCDQVELAAKATRETGQKETYCE